MVWDFQTGPLPTVMKPNVVPEIWDIAQLMNHWLCSICDLVHEISSISSFVSEMDVLANEVNARRCLERLSCSRVRQECVLRILQRGASLLLNEITLIFRGKAPTCCSYNLVYAVDNTTRTSFPSFRRR